MDKKILDNVVELVVYKIKADKMDSFPAILDSVRNELSKMKGFISYSTYLSNKTERKFIDFVLWDTMENALEGAKLFSKLPEVKPFAECFEENIMFEHFAQYKLD
jgi:quinol monooxygenase YgiN